MPLPDQDELRLRLKAARALRGLTVKDLAGKIPTESKLGERTLRKFESGEQTLLPPVMRELAVALEVPYEWFVGEDPGHRPETQLDSIQSGVYDNRARLEAIIVTLRSEIAELGRQVAEIRAVAIERVGADVLGAGTTEEPSATGEEAERTDHRQ